MWITLAFPPGGWVGQYWLPPPHCHVFPVAKKLSYHLYTKTGLSVMQNRLSQLGGVFPESSKPWMHLRCLVLHYKLAPVGGPCAHRNRGAKPSFLIKGRA